MVALFSATLRGERRTLVFMVQPMFARFVLPLLGGTPAVWTTAMLFFQTALLLAYLYAHWSTRRFGPRRQAALHLALVAAALLVLPLGPARRVDPAGRRARRSRGCCCCCSCRWGCRSSSSRPPRRCCRAGSPTPTTPTAAIPTSSTGPATSAACIGLLSYPLLVERELTLDAQSWLWSAGYGLLAVLLVASALMMWRSRRPTGDAARPATTRRRERISAGRRVRWVALAFVPSSLMLGATSAMTMNLAPIPLLWVLPLSLYLVSFILVFSRGEGAGPWHRFALYAMPPLVVVLAGMVVIGISDPLWLVIGGQPGRLLRRGARDARGAGRRPAAGPAADQFFAWVSLGGALGGVFNVVVAPTVFNSLTEYPLVLILACFLLPMRSGGWTRRAVGSPAPAAGPLLVGAVGAGLLLLTEGHVWEHRAVFIAHGPGLPAACSATRCASASR